ncbi:hypothetical protein BXO88_13195 [Oribacterium sp. C9]|nr:hypothetical protein BXO88_13195 [Oribacterium sp. C9]
MSFFDYLHCWKITDPTFNNCFDYNHCKVNVFLKNLMEEIKRGRYIILRGITIRTLDELINEIKSINDDFNVRIDYDKLLRDVTE